MNQLKNLPMNTATYLENFNKAPKFYEMEPVQVKAMLAQLPKAEYEMPAISAIADHMIKVNNGEIRVRVYQPAGTGPFPIVVYLHGGGWVLGAIEANELANRQLVLKSSAVVVSVDYRLAPDVTYPVPIDDAETAVKWVLENNEILKADSNRLYIGGDSAGANIAIAVVNRLQKQAIEVAGQLIIYPVTNLQFETDSYNRYAESFGLDKELMKWFGKHYTAGDSSLYENPEISPLRNEVSDSPRTIIIAAEHDVLVDEGSQYRVKLEEQGVDVNYHLISGTVHGFYSNVPFFEQETNDVTTILADFIGKGNV
jgi:acetyl esterase